jgi:hypothetical protein
MNRRTGAQLEQTGAAGGLEGLGFCSSAPVAPVPLGTENWSGANGPGEKLNPTTCELASKSLAAAQSRRNAVASFVPRPQIRLSTLPALGRRRSGRISGLPMRLDCRCWRRLGPILGPRLPSVYRYRCGTGVCVAMLTGLHIRCASHRPLDASPRQAKSGMTGDIRGSRPSNDRVGWGRGV